MTLRIGIDIGGTFTDLVAITEDGRVATHKTASTPHDYGEGIIDGVEALLAREPGPVTEVLHATTVGSNTVLEAKGARTALITTRGFRDILEIRDLRMPVLYDQRWTKPLALVERRLRLEVTEKMRPDGTVSIPLDAATVSAAIERLRLERVESVAICLLHSYANPAHERNVADAVRAALPDVAISVSSEILPEIKEYPRTSTTVINAYVQPVVRAYITALDARLRGLGIDAPLQLMQSNGGLASATFAAAAPAHIIESGPAAGVVGGAALARVLNEPGIITFDMGGTTAKAGLVEHGEVIRTEAIEVGGGVMAGSRLLVGAGYMLKLPAIDLAEVGAGGGSICRLDAGGAPKVGPNSAGADPGPVCYGRGGVSPTITDCNLVLGYLDPGGLVGGALKLDRDAAVSAIARDLAGPLGCSIEDAAFGMLRLASATMMRAIRAVSVERGRDPRKFALLAFGGNGPLFAAGIARELGIERVLVPPLPGVFSAFGLLVADTEHHVTQSLRVRLDAVDPDRIATVLAALTDAGTERLTRDGFTPDRQSFSRTAQARYLGQSSEIEVPLPDGDISPAAIAALFGEQHERIYGFRAPREEPVELIGLSGMARGLPERPRLPERIPPLSAHGPSHRRAWFPEEGWIETPVVDRASLGSTPRGGPLIIQEYDATCLVPGGTSAFVDGFGNIAMTVNAGSRSNG
jgi:N-methylhydantoinase A